MVKYYHIKIQKGKVVIEHKKIKVLSSIGNLVASFGRIGWIVTEYYQVFDDDDEIKFIETSEDVEEGEEVI
jgi:hypothetical protein